MTDKFDEISDIRIAASVFINCSQEFELQPEGADHSIREIAKAFQKIEMTLDPAPPCKWSISDLKVESVDVDGPDVTRVYSATVEIQCSNEDYDAVVSFMENEGYYDSDDEEFDWMAAVNYMIADTTLCPDYAEFSQESVDLDVIELE